MVQGAYLWRLVSDATQTSLQQKHGVFPGWAQHMVLWPFVAESKLDRTALSLAPLNSEVEADFSQ